jgi:hypothetical protein
MVKTVTEEKEDYEDHVAYMYTVFKKAIM